MHIFQTLKPLFLKWTCPSFIFGAIYFQFWGHQGENDQSVSQQYTAWTDCMDLQAGLAVYILVAKANHFLLKQTKGLKNLIHPKRHTLISTIIFQKHNNMVLILISLMKKNYPPYFKSLNKSLSC